jgi:hypothetical protein
LPLKGLHNTDTAAIAYDAEIEREFILTAIYQPERHTVHHSTVSIAVYLPKARIFEWLHQRAGRIGQDLSIGLCLLIQLQYRILLAKGQGVGYRLNIGGVGFLQVRDRIFAVRRNRWGKGFAAGQENDEKKQRAYFHRHEFYTRYDKHILKSAARR